RHVPEMSDSTKDSSDARAALDSISDAASAKRAARSPLAAELVRFQQHHQLPATGRLDKETVAALNITPAQRAEQLAANMERHRWLPRTLGSRYIYVNVPSFRLDAYDSGQKALSMKVVVGSEYQGRTTPTFSDSMEVAVFRPYWNITPDIQRLEVGPKAANNPGYLERENMEYYKDGGVTRIRQRPGGKNALGLVKFLFPNDFNIYLHDTPAKALFAQDDRAASHGCIRLEKPAELAQWVLGWDAARVQQAMNEGSDNHAVKLPQRIPVYIVYFTAYLRDGELVFADDLYGRDDALEKQITHAT
ncbi:MAG TPA: L,D-transpeptidase family protein, partial [Gemmatimonadaceae bacterium]|nr:L,D-transpeptidase family protein [Gemmatimonadaceae bacterium]